MSAGNLFETRRKGFVQRTKEITTSATVTTYTVRLGGASDNFICDRVINVTTTDGNDLAIALGSGTYEGQRLLINFVTEGNAETITVTAATGSGGDSTMATAGMYMSLEWMNSTVGWVVLAESVTT